MLGRGLFGLTLPSDSFDGSHFQLLKKIVSLYGETVLTEVAATIEEKTFPKFFTKLIVSLGHLNLNDPDTQQLINELYSGLSKAADKAFQSLLPYLDRFED